MYITALEMGFAAFGFCVFSFLRSFVSSKGRANIFPGYGFIFQGWEEGWVAFTYRAERYLLWQKCITREGNASLFAQFGFDPQEKNGNFWYSSLLSLHLVHRTQSFKRLMSP